MPAKKKSRLLASIIKWSAIPGAVLALVVLWSYLGIATSGDIKRLDRNQSEAAIEIFNTKMRSLLAIAPPKETAARRAWEEELATTRQQLNQAQSRKLELSK